VKRRARLGIFLLVAVIASGSLMGCSAKKQEDEVIKIGYIENLTGDMSGYGLLAKMGIELAHELKPTVLGKKVEIVTVDSKSDKTEAANAASRLIEQEKVVAILGPGGSGINLAIGEIIKTAKIPTLTNNATSPLITKDNPWYFRCCFTNDFKAEAMASFAYEQGWRKVGIVVEITNDSAVNSVATFKNAFVKLTGDPDACPVEVSYSSSDTDFSAQLGVLSRYELDGIYNPGGYAYVPLMVNQALDLGLDYKWLGTDSWQVKEFVDLGGEAVVDRCFFPTFFDPNGEEMTPTTPYLIEQFAKKYGKDEEVASVTALGFDAYNIMLHAIETAGKTDNESIRAALVAMKDFPGATGYITFDADRNVENVAVIEKVGADGKFKFVTAVYPKK
jgi:branched-chain amino acid transport system substrate-binding protein